MSAGGGGNRYQMRQKMAAIGDDFWIENDNGQIIVLAVTVASARCPTRVTRPPGRLTLFKRVQPKLRRQAEVAPSEVAQSQ